MYVNLILELSMITDNDTFQEVFSEFYWGNGYENENKEYPDLSMEDEGILILYCNRTYKKKIRAIVNVALLAEDAADKPQSVSRKIDKRLTKYFDSQYSLNDFVLKKAMLIKDIDIGCQAKIEQYIKVIGRLGKVKGYAPAKYEGLEHGTAFCLDGNSNGRSFLIYNLQEQVANRMKQSKGDKHLRTMFERANGMLRCEVRLNEHNAIRNCVGDGDTYEQVAEIAGSAKDIFLSVFSEIVPYGDYYKKGRAIEIIQEKIVNAKLRRRMIYLVSLLPDKKSMLLSQKTLNCRNIDSVMEAFAKISLSPVTISKRMDVKRLPNIYSYL